MNKKTNLQIPISTNITMKAKKKAKDQGFSSLQELVRIFITNYANTDMGVTFGSISSATEEELIKDLEEVRKDIKSGKAKIHNSAKEAIEYLDSL